MPHRVSRRMAYRKGASGTASRALRKVNVLEKRLNSDPKWVTSVLDATPDSTGTSVSIFPIAQGTDENERLGDRILVHSILIKGIGIQDASAAAGTQVRWALVRAPLGTTTAPTIVEVFGTVALMSQNRRRLFNSDSTLRFKVLADKFIVFPAFGDNRSTQKINYYHKFKKPLNVTYSNTGATDEGPNHIYIMVACNEGINVPAFAWDVVVKYSDS